MSLNTDPAIQAYFASEAEAGVDVFETIFASDASVTDEGKTHSGIEAIKAWKQNAKLKHQYIVEPLDSQVSNAGTAVQARLSGTFPRSSVVVAYLFGVQHGKIQTLEIN
ncbi:nuclear transport factor 2 family protein [Pseudomonas syringae group genomosp. 3]|uniref:nuclear transport factor 2 family protein n=1 Tax=Pseudomonas syringae group genomosp. 3 TaxID=251701 RepID=UPI000EFA737F|nr:nuclear transport factor 2 family protein [Pseudomonas syringae group genomosp. 3]